jgi:hypothetical protein
VNYGKNPRFESEEGVCPHWPSKTLLRKADMLSTELASGAIFSDIRTEDRSVCSSSQRSSGGSAPK